MTQEELQNLYAHRMQELLDEYSHDLDALEGEVSTFKSEEQKKEDRKKIGALLESLS